MLRSADFIEDLLKQDHAVEGNCKRKAPPLWEFWHSHWTPTV